MIYPDTPTVLVVEDDIAHRLMLTSLLEEWGYRVKEAANGLEAVQSVRSHPFHAVLMDLRMPRMDGLEATRIIRQLRPDLPVIMVTASPPGEVMRKAREAGVMAFVFKPLDIDKLKGALKRALDLGRGFARENLTCCGGPGEPCRAAGEVSMV